MSDADRNALDALTSLADELAANVDLPLSLQVGDHAPLQLGSPRENALKLSLQSPGVIASMVRWPTLDRLIQHYARGDVSLSGGTIIELGRALDDPALRRRLKAVPKRRLLQALWPFLRVKPERPGAARAFAGDESGDSRQAGRNQDFIQFHYDVGNDFYALFLDPELQYSCAYFNDWSHDLETAQKDKIDIICRKLRLQGGDRFLDIGCGWGGLICHAAEAYGATAHGITLSKSQYDRVSERIAQSGLQGRVTVEIRDYADLQGTYDKIASVGMFEHIGLKNADLYFKTVRRVLAPDGLFLNHAITRKAKRKNKKFSSRAEQRALQKYIFPGGELDDIGNTVASMEKAGFGVHDVEGLREHYARTTEIWCRRLTERREEAIALVGEQTYRIWVAYLGGCCLAFERGSARIFQTLAAHSAKGRSPLPPTRDDIYMPRT